MIYNFEYFKEFYNGKRVLVTGHTGFKGSWMCMVLSMLGAKVTGYSLDPTDEEMLFELCDIKSKVNSVTGDIRNLEALKRVFDETKPEIVIHMAAQPLVRESYINPVYTYDVNVMGTVNVLECIRLCDSVKSAINVTTDKVYKNSEKGDGFTEEEELNGYDPYSNSKSCSELVTSSYINSYFNNMEVEVSTMRAGNVIGGGDFAKDRIIPDCYRAMAKGEDIILRNPYAVRPFQHVLEPVMAYLLLAKLQYEDKGYQSSYNIGPELSDCVEVGRLTDLFIGAWEKYTGVKKDWINKHDGGPHEAGFLRLDCCKIKERLLWKARWDIKAAVDKTVEWYAAYLDKKDMSEVTKRQITEFLQD